ncbi:hypothetical protein AX15_004207 [Amanita polypyramis BW_CC]|nr:hypothetical protein AX15_004207 [Amanita polypyramis BW_CC]
MTPDATHRTRPATPDTPLTNSLYSPTHTIEDLTSVLAEFSQRVPSPDPPLRLACCCGKEDCESLSNWLATKGRLESRLRLSAEVGQALLQRHEAYVRRHEVPPKRQASIAKSLDSMSSDEVPASQEDKDGFVAELLKEKTLLEKRLNQALIHNEVSEVSTKSILRELDEARATISRLTANQARSTGWDVRLSAAMKERDDMQQERDAESQRARLAESRFTALKEKTAKLQTEVRRLQEALELKRVTHMESSESTLQDARMQIQLMQSGQLSRDEHDELTRVLESLVNDNEILKRDNAELQILLSDCREDLHALQEEVEEQRAIQGPSPRTLKHKRSIAASISAKEFSMPVPGKRNTSLERSLHAFEPLTPETNHRPLSPATHLSTPSESQRPPRAMPSHPSFQITYDLDPDALDDHEEPAVPDKLLLPRSRGVQVNGAWASSMPLSQFRHLSQYGAMLHPAPLTNSDPRSESSSFSSETMTSHIATLLERLSQLFSKLSQADALTLTNRLKRQHLYHNPGDVKHLSRSTVNQILTETAALRSQFRMLLEDEKAVAVCTRKEVRVLFRLMREMFGEMGRMRVVLNDVILDPSDASRLSDAAMDPRKGGEDGLKNESKDVALSWMAPLSKWFSPGSRVEKHQHQAGVGGPLSGGSALGPALTKSSSTRSGVSGVASLGAGGAGGTGGAIRPRTITAPKNAPALASCATTVNVEFLGASIKGKSVTNTFSRTGAPAPPISEAEQLDPDWQTQSTVSGAGGGSRSAMDIFAGAPTRNSGLLEPEPWIVLPKAPRKAVSSVFYAGTKGNRTGRSTPLPALDADSSGITKSPVEGLGGATGGLSRYVDAVIDPVFGRAPGPSSYLQPLPPVPSQDENSQHDVPGENSNPVRSQINRSPLRRGLSDSSIHSTFTSHAADPGEQRYPRSPIASISMANAVVPNRQGRFPVMWPDKQSVLRALSRTVQNFRLGQNGGPESKANVPASSSTQERDSDMDVDRTDSQDRGRSSLPQRLSGEGTRMKAPGPRNVSSSGGTPRKGVRIKHRHSALLSSGVPYYGNTVSGAMGAAALLNSLPAPASMRDPFVWEA